MIGKKKLFFVTKYFMSILMKWSIFTIAIIFIILAPFLLFSYLGK